MLLPLLALSAALPAQEPVGGWHRPIWSIDSEAGQVLDVTPLVDFDGDGIVEAFVQHGTRGELVSGATGLPWIVQQVPLGVARAHAHDLDGDGAPDLILGEPDYMEAMTVATGRITAWSGANFQAMWRSIGKDGDRLGEGLSFVDVNGDGLPDLRAMRIASASARATALRGNDGNPLWSVRDPGYDLGDWIPDLNGDGVDELLIGRAGGLACFSGATGNQLWTSNQYHAQSQRWSSALVGELDGQPGLELCLGTASFRSGGTNDGIIQVFDAQTGMRRWEVQAWVVYEDLAENLTLLDADGDGDLEVLSAARKQLVQFDGATGLELWRRDHSHADPAETVYLSHQDGDGILDAVLHHRGRRGFLEAYSGKNGQVLWYYEGRTSDEGFAHVLPVDLDQNGIQDYITASPDASGLTRRGGSVRAINGETGTLFWARGGALENSRLGAAAMLAELDGQPGLDLVLRANPLVGTNPETGYLGVHGLSGAKIWDAALEPRNRDSETWDFVDLQGAGMQDLLILGGESPTMSTRGLMLQGADGGIAWAHRLKSTGHASGAVLITAVHDANGDQLRDLLWLRRLPDGRTILELVSGADLAWQSGLSASGDQLSVSAGGALQLQLDLPSDAARHFYQVLASVTGTGPTEVIGLPVPLSDDVALMRTLSGLDQGILRPQIGRLDAASQASVDLVLAPSQFGASLVGRTLYLAAITQPTPSVAPERSTQAVAIQLLP